MIEYDKEYDVYQITCDLCPQTDEFEEGLQFVDVILLAKREGWRIKKVGGAYEHYCPSCSKKN